MNAGFYTYIHTRVDDGKVFYVGKGKGARAHSTKGRNQRWVRTAAKHGLKVDIAARWPTEAEAFDHERLLIACFRDMGHPLCAPRSRRRAAVIRFLRTHASVSRKRSAAHLLRHMCCSEALTCAGESRFHAKRLKRSLRRGLATRTVKRPERKSPRRPAVESGRKKRARSWTGSTVAESEPKSSKQRSRQH